MNLKFEIAYDGSTFFGSQKQANKNTVEDELLKAFKNINIDTKIVLSGRTDRDVHATGQVFNSFIPDYWEDLEKLKEILNNKLSRAVKIKKISKVNDNFHARFSAKKRVYRYIISSKQTTPFNDKFVTYVKNIDEDLLKKSLLGFMILNIFIKQEVTKRIQKERFLMQNFISIKIFMFLNFVQTLI